ncbi:MAG: protease pro-enzyme activation domain-containing protein [Bryobacteraceae bacterium]
MPNEAAATRIVLAGSERSEPANAQDLGPVDPSQEAEVTVHLKSKVPESEMEQLVNNLSSKPPSERKYLTRQELAELRAPSPEDIARVEAFAKRYGLAVMNRDASSRTMTLRGKLGDLEKAFGVKLHNYTAGGTVFRGRTGSISVPADVAPVVTGVFGLDTRPAARPK